MSIHYSIGLVPEEVRCHRHGKTMRLSKPEKIPMFGCTSSPHPYADKYTRRIYRCKVKGCPVVASGPTKSFHAARELTLEMVNPW